MNKIEAPTAGSIVRQATFNTLAAAFGSVEQNVTALERTANGRGVRVTTTSESREIDDVSSDVAGLLHAYAMASKRVHWQPGVFEIAVTSPSGGDTLTCHARRHWFPDDPEEADQKDIDELLDRVKNTVGVS